MGLTGRTNNKLFKLKRVDINEPYKVGANNVTEIIVDEDEGSYIISYILDGIRYRTYAKTDITDPGLNSKLYLTPPASVGELVKFKKLTNKEDEEVFIKDNKKTNQKTMFKPDLKKGKTEVLVKRIKLPITRNIAPVVSESPTVTDTFYFTEKLSFESFIEEKIYKKEKYVGLISKPIVTSDVFMERDTNALFERQQRLSEINNLSELIEYKNGYYNVTNTF